MQPSYKDSWSVSKKFREMMAKGEMNETQLIFFGPKKEPEELYNLASDIGETTNVLGDHAGVAKRLATLAEGMRADLGDELTGAKGSGTREAGFVKNARTLTKRK